MGICRAADTGTPPSIWGNRYKNNSPCLQQSRLNYFTKAKQPQLNFKTHSANKDLVSSTSLKPTTIDPRNILTLSHEPTQAKRSSIFKGLGFLLRTIQGYVSPGTEAAMVATGVPRGKTAIPSRATVVYRDKYLPSYLPHRARRACQWGILSDSFWQ